MIYIHMLKDLNPKSLEIEATPLVREIKSKHKLPLPEEKVREEFNSYFPSENDLALMEKALSLIPVTVQEINSLPVENSSYEPVNLQRAASELQEIYENLNNSIAYLKKNSELKAYFLGEIVPILNKIPKVKDYDELLVYEKKVCPMFEELLRNDKDFVFNYRDVIHETHTMITKSLIERMDKGFFFHMTMDEYLNKSNFKLEISKRIPVNDLAKVDEITKKIAEIRLGVEKAYSHNMNMISASVLLYSYLKWLKEV